MLTHFTRWCAVSRLHPKKTQQAFELHYHGVSWQAVRASQALHLPQKHMSRWCERLTPEFSGSILNPWTEVKNFQVFARRNANMTATICMHTHYGMWEDVLGWTREWKKFAVGRNLKKREKKYSFILAVSEGFQIADLSDSLTSWTPDWNNNFHRSVPTVSPTLERRRISFSIPGRKSSEMKMKEIVHFFSFLFFWLTPSSQRTHFSLLHPPDSILKQCDLLIMEHRVGADHVLHITRLLLFFLCYVTSGNKGYLSL